jgi:hypothetical protein
VARHLRAARSALADLLPEHIASRMEEEAQDDLSSRGLPYAAAALRRVSSAARRSLHLSRDEPPRPPTQTEAQLRASADGALQPVRRQHHIAEWHECVTVLFADVVGFTTLSDQARARACCRRCAHMQSPPPAERDACAPIHCLRLYVDGLPSARPAAESRHESLQNKKNT